MREFAGSDRDRRPAAPRARRRAFVAAVLLSCAAVSCGGQADLSSRSRSACVDGGVDRHTLAIRFAPVLMLHADEPYRVVSVFAVFHPSKPLVAYHVFFEDDVLLAGRGKSLDHEIAWVEYDPVTLKATDVFTLWHRTVLRTDACLMDAKASGQRPRLDVQWGQHGLLPHGWKNLVTARPRLELATHYELARYLNRLPKASARDRAVSFRGSYGDYVTFDVRVDAADYIRADCVIEAPRSREYLNARLGETFLLKKEWPDW